MTTKKVGLVMVLSIIAVIGVAPLVSGVSMGDRTICKDISIHAYLKNETETYIIGGRYHLSADKLTYALWAPNIPQGEYHLKVTTRMKSADPKWSQKEYMVSFSDEEVHLRAMTHVGELDVNIALSLLCALSEESGEVLRHGEHTVMFFEDENQRG